MKTLMTTSLLAILAAPAFAGVDIRDYDLDGDRFVTFGELAQSAPGLTRSDFRTLDRNGDRRLSANELDVARFGALVSHRVATRNSGSEAVLTLGDARFDEIDADRDGRITFDELARIDVPSLNIIRGE